MEGFNVNCKLRKFNSFAAYCSWICTVETTRDFVLCMYKYDTFIIYIPHKNEKMKLISSKKAFYFLLLRDQDFICFLLLVFFSYHCTGCCFFGTPILMPCHFYTRDDIDIMYFV